MAKEATMTREKKENIKWEREMWLARSMGIMDGIIAVAEEERRTNAKAKLATRKAIERKSA
jgi:hypothetical protein